MKDLLPAIQAAVKRFPKEGGVVVNISSGVAKTPMAQAHVYPCFSARRSADSVF